MQRNRLLYLTILASLVFNACNLPSWASEGSSAGAARTESAITLVAEMTRIAATSTSILADASPTYTQTPLSSTATPTETPAPTHTKQPEPTSTPIPCNLAQFVKDVTIPDGKVFFKGDHFTKVWRLRNIGSCSWTRDYSLFYSSGDKMGGATFIPFEKVISSGQTVDLLVDLTAPDEPGEYLGNWMLRSGSGAVFGIGAKADHPFWVQVKVVERVVEWNRYRNDYFHIRLDYPSDWDQVDGEPHLGEKFAGQDGFFGIMAIEAGGSSIDQLAENEAHHVLLPYGTQPTIESGTVHGQEARLILPSIDQYPSMQGQAELIVRYPQPVEINGHFYDFFVLHADKGHIRAMTNTLRFISG